MNAYVIYELSLRGISTLYTELLFNLKKPIFEGDGVDSCTMVKHTTMKMSNQTCISKDLVTECATWCKPINDELLEIEINFTCFANERLGQYYLEKADRFERMPEIEVQPTNFKSMVAQPRSCVPTSNDITPL